MLCYFPPEILLYILELLLHDVRDVVAVKRTCRTLCNFVKSHVDAALLALIVRFRDMDAVSDDAPTFDEDDDAGWLRQRLGDTGFETMTRVIGAMHHDKLFILTASNSSDGDDKYYGTASWLDVSTWWKDVALVLDTVVQENYSIGGRLVIAFWPRQDALPAALEPHAVLEPANGQPIRIPLVKAVNDRSLFVFTTIVTRAQYDHMATMPSSLAVIFE